MKTIHSLLVSTKVLIFALSRIVHLSLSTANIIANVRHASLYERASRVIRKKMELRSDSGGHSGSKKCKRGYGGAYGGVWRSLRLAGVWSETVGFVLLRFAGIWLQSL
jgi:hypothetical protein